MKKICKENSDMQQRACMIRGLGKQAADSAGAVFIAWNMPVVQRAGP